jgi:hypothetical protein
LQYKPSPGRLPKTLDIVCHNYVGGCTRTEPINVCGWQQRQWRHRKIRVLWKSESMDITVWRAGVDAYVSRILSALGLGHAQNRIHVAKNGKAEGMNDQQKDALEERSGSCRNCLGSHGIGCGQ